MEAMLRVHVYMYVFTAKGHFWKWNNGQQITLLSALHLPLTHKFPTMHISSNNLFSRYPASCYTAHKMKAKMRGQNNNTETKAGNILTSWVTISFFLTISFYFSSSSPLFFFFFLSPDLHSCGLSVRSPPTAKLKPITLAIVHHKYRGQLNPWRRVLLEKLTVTQLVKKFPWLYRNQRFITVFVRERHWFLFWARCIHFTLTELNHVRSILILSSHPHPGLPSGYFPSCFPTIILYIFLPCMLHSWPSAYLLPIYTLHIYLYRHKYVLIYICLYSKQNFRHVSVSVSFTWSSFRVIQTTSWIHAAFLWNKPIFLCLLYYITWYQEIFIQSFQRVKTTALYPV
jgi:hypothetical protein